MRLTLFVVFMLLDWPFDGPPSQRLAYGLMFAANLVLVATAAQSWRAAVGMQPATSASDARYALGEVVLLIPAMALLYMDFGGDWAPWRIAAFAILVAALLAMTVLNLRDRRRRKGEIVAPIAAMTVRTHLGDREVLIAQPEGVNDRWATRWSIGGTPVGTIQRVSYGPDPMRSLAAALADAEAATVVL